MGWFNQSRRSRWIRAMLWVPVASLSLSGSGWAAPPPRHSPPDGARNRPRLEPRVDRSVAPVKPDVPSTAPAGAAPAGVPGGLVVVSDLPTRPWPSAPGGWQAHIQGEFLQEHDPEPGGSAESLKAPKQLLFEPQLPTVEAEGQQPEDDGGPAAPGGYVQQWTGLRNTGWIPPDTIHAVGPAHIVEAVNSGFGIYAKFGTEVQGYTTFESFLNKPAGWTGFMFDPRIVYDATHEKFVMLVLGRDDNAVRSYFWIAVSQTPDPTAGWWIWRFDATDESGASTAWLDYAGVAADSWGVYVTGNYFYFSGGYRGSNLWSINPDILNGGATNGWRFLDLRWPSNAQAFALQPAHPHSISAAQQTFFVNTFSGSGSEVCLWKLSGDRTNAPTLTRVAIPTAGYEAIGMNVDQPGSATDIDGGDARVMNAVYSQSRVFFTLTDDVNNNGDSAGWLTVKVNVNSNANEWQHLLWGGAGRYYFYPAVTIQGGANPDANLAVFGSWTQTVGGDQFASGLYKFYDNQPAADTGPLVSHTSGVAAYVALDNIGRNRWGDYSGAVYDWTCGHAWGAVEAADMGNRWRTVIAARLFGNEPMCPQVGVTTPNGGEVWNAGTNHSINWLRQGLDPANQMFLFYEDGTTSHPIAGPLPTSAASFNWSVPGIPSTRGKIFVGSRAGSVYEASDRSDAFFTVTAPDLAVVSPSVSASLLAPGEAVAVNATASNLGSGSSNVATTLLFLLSSDATITPGDTLIGSAAVGVLAPGGASPQSTGATAPAAAGNYWVGACVDAVAGESTTANQCSSGVPVTVALPDLVVQAIDAPASSGPGLVASVSTAVRNQGTIGTGVGFRVGLYYSADSTCGEGVDVLVGSRVVGALAAGATSAASVTVTFPAAAATGTRYVCAIADDLSAVGETDEGNNTGSDSIQIQPPTPVITLKVNGQHPTPPVLTVAGPAVVTVDVSPSTYTASVEWYWAIVFSGQVFWVTAAGLSATPAPWFTYPPVELANVTLLSLTLPPGTTMTNALFMLSGTTVVGFDYITATRP